MKLPFGHPRTNLGLGIALGSTIATLSISSAGAMGQSVSLPRSDGERVLFVDETPASIEFPRIPSLETPPDAATPPVAIALDRNFGVADQFGAVGESVDYPFESEAGELSIFEIGSYGFARGWESEATVQVLDASNRVIAATTREGGASYEIYFPVVTPRAGTYRLRLTSTREWFRFSVLRHSNYVTHGPNDVLEVRGRDLVHGHLMSPQDRVTYSIHLDAEEEILIQALPTLDRHRRQMRKTRRSAIERDQFESSMSPHRARSTDPDAGGSMQRTRGGSRSRQLTGAIHIPHLAVSVERDGVPIASGRHFARVVAPEGGEYRVVVYVIDGDDGTRFDLRLARQFESAEIRGFVGDDQDDPVAGIKVQFLREPDFDDVGFAVSDDAGEFTFSVPTGDYTILVGNGERPPEIVRAAFTAASELNVIYLPPPEPPTNEDDDDHEGG